MLLAGRLRGRALVEWNLLSTEEKSIYSAAKHALRTRLDPGSKVIAAQDFRHAIQKDEESVSDFIRRMERCFQVAYGRDNLSVETRETILFGQLQEGLRFNIVKSPSVSGSQSYKELCMAAKNEEKRIAGLQRRQQYQHGGGTRENSSKQKGQLPPARKDTSEALSISSQLVSAMSVGALSNCHGIARSPSKGERALAAGRSQGRRDRMTRMRRW